MRVSILLPRSCLSALIGYNSAMPLDLPRIQALCFDVDGTLSDTDDYMAANVAAWMRRVPGLSHPEPLARRLVMWMESPGTFLMGLADRLYIDDELIGAISWMYRRAHRPGRLLPCVPGVATLLRALNQRYPMAVVSARDELSTMTFLRRAGLRNYFKVVVTALSARYTKPFPDPVLLAASQLGVAPEACLMIGDTTADIRAGRAAGAQTVGVLCGFGEQAALRRHGADVILSSTADLRSLLLQA
jgi:HAD superfamily hydrolase (TIGR01509 family)